LYKTGLKDEAKTHLGLKEPVATGTLRTSGAPVCTAGGWSMDKSFRLCSDAEIERYAEKAMLIDRAALISVAAAIDGLNSGTIECAQGWIIVYSGSHQEWYVLYKTGLKDEAITSLGL